MNIYKNGLLVDEYIPSYGNRKIVISIDSSKSNSAIAVSDEFGNILDDYEISGAGAETDVFDLCAMTRRQLKSLFRGADILLVGIEDIITKNYKGGKDSKGGKNYGHVNGLDVHQSRHKITAVFDNFMFLFEEFFDIRPIRVNNWDWKVGVLPEEYRKRDHDKGSLDWFNDMGNRWAGRKDDVTDAVCINWYLHKMNKIKAVYEVKETMPTNVQYDVAIMPISVPIPTGAKEFVITNNDILQHNLDTIAERIEYGQLGITKVKTSNIPIDWIYSGRLKYTRQYSYDRMTDEVLVTVERK